LAIGRYSVTLKQLVVKNGLEMEEIGVVVAEIIERTLTERAH